MPPFRPLFSRTNIKLFKYSMILYCGKLFKITLKMTVTEVKGFERKEKSLTLPELPGEYLEVTLIDNNEECLEEIIDIHPLAISDATEECILSAKKLSKGENVKEIYLIELSSRLPSYHPGDTVGVITKNKEEDVQRLFDHLGITHLSKKLCKLSEKVPPKKNQCRPPFLNKITTLNHIFTHFLDIHCIPKKSLIRVLSEFTENPKEKQYLEELCSKEKSESYTKNILEANKDFLDLLLEMTSCKPPIARLVENLPKLFPRPYSIASSPLASPNSIKIVFSVIKTTNEREGLCSGMLKNLVNNSHEDKKVKMFFRRGNGFNLPEEDVPLILVGPGTGIAPFMGFLEHRKMQGSSGIIWVFYGCRYKNRDYLFEEELQEYLKLGVLTKLTVAFSRECDVDAKYVQDNLRKHGEELTSLIFEQNALIYVCGDAKNMKKDIQNSFIEIFENHKGMTNKEANDCMKKLQKDKRYILDIWI